MMTPERIAELRALAAQAAPGPWKIHPSKGGDPTVVCIVERFDLSVGAVEAGSEWGVFHRKDAAFIAAARTALPEALNEIERLWLYIESKKMREGTRLRFEVQQDRFDATEWRVEAIDSDEDGAVYVAIFSGPKARERAEEYAAFKNPNA